MAEPHSSNFRVITTNFWGVQIFRKFTVASVAEQAGLSLTSSQTRKTGFLVTWLISACTVTVSLIKVQFEPQHDKTNMYVL